MKKLASLLLCVTLLVCVMAPCAYAAEADTAVQEIVWDENEETILLTDEATYGEGEKTFTFEVIYKWMITSVTVNTDAETVGEALAELNIIAGDESEWGLYVKTVNGITADYNVDGSYWAFYIDGEYAMTGVDSTEITEGSVYCFAVEGLEWTMDEGETIILKDGRTYGQGETAFTFTVVDLEGTETTVTINTDAKTVGEALSALYIIAGEDSEWGLYVKTVNGTTVSYDEDGKYWAFYIDGEYAMTGVDATEITAGSTYTFKAE